MSAAPDNPHERARDFRERHRDYGVFVPAREVELHALGGWRLLDDLADDRGARDVALMRWPAEERVA